MPLEYPYQSDFNIKWQGSIAVVKYPKCADRICTLHSVHSMVDSLHVATLMPSEKHGKAAWLNEHLRSSKASLQEISTIPGTLSSGYFNYKNYCFYKARLSKKQFKKGINSGNCELLIPPSLQDFAINDIIKLAFEGLSSPEIVERLVTPPTYPTPDEAIKLLQKSKPKTYAIAIHPNIALSVFTYSNNIGIYFKNNLIGLLDPSPSKNHITSSQIMYLDYRGELQKLIWEPLSKLI